MSEPLQLPEAVLKRLIEAANAAGTTAVEWIQSRLPMGHGCPPRASDDEINLADARLDQCVIHLG